MRNVYHHVLIGVLALTFLWAALTSDFLIGSEPPMGKITPPSSPSPESLAHQQSGQYYQLFSEEIGRRMIPNWCSVQW